MAFDVEQFFESIDIVLTQKLTDLSYDKTVIATIVDDSDKDKGHYVVSNGTIKFDAYTNDDTYRVDDQVRVTILNGDWTQKKFIAGKYIAENGTNPVAYIPPLGTIRADSQSSYSMNDSWVLYTNQKQNKPQLIWHKSITPDSREYMLQTNGICNIITLSGDFQTQFDAIEGNYGLLLELFITIDPDSNERIKKFITFDSTEMLGNPYSYVIDSHQEKQILIASEGVVTEIFLSIYESSNFDVTADGEFEIIDNPFIGYDGNLIPSTNQIVFKNIVVGFGSDLTKIEDNKLQLCTMNSSTYHYNGGLGDLTNDKEMEIIWYNKNEKNEYIGFKDGIVETDSDNNIIDYDEIQYKYENNVDNRLTSRKGISGVPTDFLSLYLCANIEESIPHMLSAYRSLTGAYGGSQDLIKALQTIGRSLGKTTLKSELDKLITGSSAVLSVQAEKAEEYYTKMNERYTNVLRYGYETQNELEHTKTWDEIWDSSEPSYYNNFCAAIDVAITSINTFLDYFYAETAPGTVLSGYRGVYDSYVHRVKKALAAIELDLEKIKHTSPASEDQSAEREDETVHLKSYNSKTKDDFVAYAEKDLSSWDNKYCIYWYRYNERYLPSPITILKQDAWNPQVYPYADSYEEYEKLCKLYNFEYENCRFLGDKWERIVFKDSNGKPMYNIGLPTTVGETINNIKYFPINPVIPITVYNRMDPTFKEERFQVVLFYNHMMIKSNVLTFINTEADLIPEEFDVNAQDMLKIDHGAHSQDHYQSYTSAFDLVNIADERRTRELTVSYDGIVLGDEALAGAGIYWYIPINSTMLTYDKDILINKLGFVSDIDQRTEFSKDGYIYFYKKIRYIKEDVDATDVDGNLIYNADGSVATDEKITLEEVDRHFSYKIKPYYEASAQNNTILVDAYINNVGGEVRKVSGEITLTFSTFGTNGTKYTLVVVPADSQIASLPADSNNTNPILKLDVSLRDAENKLLELSTDSLPDIQSEDWKDEPVLYALKAEWYALSDKNAGGVILELAEDKKSAKITIPKGIEDDNGYVGIIRVEVSYNTTGKTSTESRVISLSTLYPVSFSSSNDHYISGPTTIVYNNQGTVSRMSEEPYCLYSRYAVTENKDQDGQNITIENVEIQNQKWNLLYYNNNGVSLDVLDPKILGYMPTLNSDNTITPAPMYYHYENGEFYIPVARCYIEDDNGNESTLWTQPIVITQNQYASSILNDWNGQFNINEENGTIMSTMIGAGKKTVNNEFEGILMGDIVAGAEFDIDNADGIGLYGFNEGAQSFFFGVNGKAFLGKAGRGRINFDGNSGTISSASYQQTRTPVRDQDGKITSYLPSSAGMMIDLDDGFIDMHGTAGSVELTEVQFNQAKTERGEYPDCADYREYQTKYCNGKYEIPNSNYSRIRMDTISPYFRIHSAAQTKENQYILYVGDDAYFLQSDDFKSCSFDLSEKGQVSYDGAGMFIDLKKGEINAYNFLLMSKNILIDNRDNANAYFAIKDNTNQILMLVQENPDGTNEYYLKTSNYVKRMGDTPGAGAKLDLGRGSLQAYNFSLEAGNCSKTNASGQSVYYPNIQINSVGSPYFCVRDKKANELIVISTADYFLQTSDFKTNVSGMKIDLTGNSIEAYSGFNLTAFKKNSTTNYISIDTNNPSYPLYISGKSPSQYTTDTNETNTFSVGWDGRVSATDGVFRGFITAKGGVFEDTITAKGKISGGLISGARVEGGMMIGTNVYAQQIDVGYTKETTATKCPYTGDTIYLPKAGSGKFTVDSTGHLIAKSATIGGWDVTETKITNNGITLSGVSTTTKDEDGTFTLPGIQSDYWTVGKEGVMRIKDLVIVNSFEVSKLKNANDMNSQIDKQIFSVNSSGDMAFEGKLWLGPDRGSGKGRILGFGWGGQEGGELGGTSITSNSVTLPADDGTKGFKTIRIDTPWSNKVGLATYYNGILVGWNEVSSSFSDFWGWITGEGSKDNTNLGSDNEKPIFIQKGSVKAFSKKLGALAFKDDLKKKFNITLSGTCKNTGLYVFDKTVEDVPILSTLPSVYYFDSSVYYMDYNGERWYSGNLVYGNPGTFAYVDIDFYTPAGTLKVTAKDDINVTLDGSDTATTDIDVSSSSATITIS